MWFLLVNIFQIVPLWASQSLGTTPDEKCVAVRLDDDYNCTYCEPEQIHIAFGENLNDIVVMWSTLDKKKVGSVVHYGVGNLQQTAEGETWLFQDGGHRKRSQWMHRVELNNLQPNTTYVYKVGSSYAWSEELVFKTPPAGEDWVVSAAIYGDLGLMNARSLPRLKAEAERGAYDFIIHVGDLAYDLHFEDGQVGDQFMRMLQPLASRVPYMTCPGNHEAAYNFSHYKARFSMPGARAHDGLYYSWNAGPVHFISYSTEFYYGDVNTSAVWWHALKRQFRWIKADLIEATKKENREKRPWIIMYGHRPMYCSSAADECPLPDVPQRQGKGLPEPGYGLEPLLKDFGVDLSINGHEHAYERMLPLYDHRIYNGSGGDPYRNPQAPVHLITGSAGCYEDTYPINKRKPWTVFSSSDYGYTRFKAYNKTHLHIEQVSVDKEGKIIDSFWLIRDKHSAYSI
ncbi:calcineurin-like phosphoesterase domain-containing protein [Phthorimaea operculella]|nr:calcineurin-like phosphoesterase domain-containing protein [Phthorimaea operculella]